MWNQDILTLRYHFKRKVLLNPMQMWVFDEPPCPLLVVLKSAKCNHSYIPFSQIVLPNCLPYFLHVAPSVLLLELGQDKIELHFLYDSLGHSYFLAGTQGFLLFCEPCFHWGFFFDLAPEVLDAGPEASFNLLVWTSEPIVDWFKMGLDN